eukprot:1158379-Pelagomonas_calceolata.AAC.8
MQATSGSAGQEARASIMEAPESTGGGCHANKREREGVANVAGTSRFAQDSSPAAPPTLPSFHPAAYIIQQHPCTACCCSLVLHAATHTCCKYTELQLHRWHCVHVQQWWQVPRTIHTAQFAQHQLHRASAAVHVQLLTRRRRVCILGNSQQILGVHPTDGPAHWRQCAAAPVHALAVGCRQALVGIILRLIVRGRVGGGTASGARGGGLDGDDGGARVGSLLGHHLCM